MIARIWKGTTPASKAEKYFEYIKKTGVEGLSNTPGNRGIYVFRKVHGDAADFLILSLWDSLGAIKIFAGEDFEKARLYPEDEDYLTRFDTAVSHYDVLLFHPKSD